MRVISKPCGSMRHRTGSTLLETNTVPAASHAMSGAQAWSSPTKNGSVSAMRRSADR